MKNFLKINRALVAKKKLTLLFALLCASVMGWADTEYCGHEITGVNHGHKMSVTYKSLGSNQYTLIMTSTDDIVSYNAAGSNFYTEVNGVGGTQVSANLTQDGNTLTYTVTSNPKPNVYVGDFYVNYSDGEEHYNIPTDEDWTATCSGGSTPPATKYVITVTQPAAGGTIGADVEEAAAGATVHLTATPASGKALDEWIVTAGSDPVTVTNNQFTMPASAVTVTATFKDHDPNEYTAGGHTIHLDASYVDIDGTNKNYTLVITSEDDMTGLGGSFWFVNGVAKDMRTNDETKSYTVSGDKKTITCTAQSATDITFDSPLYILFPGEVNFGKPTLNWEDRTPINSEYCSYQGSETLGGGTYIALTWETDPSGNVVITMSNGTGTSSCSFRNGGFEGGINAFVVSTDNFVTSAPASDYFTAVQVYSGNTYTLTKIADLPANAKIKHVGSGHALAWVANGNNQYSFPDFVYTYGGTCNQLDAPTNVSIDANNIITFDAVTGASSYTAYVSLSGVQKYSQVVVSGDELTFTPLVDGDYDVTVVASGTGKTDSDPSSAFVWSLTAAPIVLGNSEYCEHIMQTGADTEAAFTWETDGSGNIVITISETLGGAADASHFRANALALGNFKVGTGKAAGSNYFSHPGTTTGNQLVLTATNAPAPGEKIYYDGVVEYATSKDGNAWPTLQFEWTYGTICSGKAVSATPNNNTMGTAVVKKAGVEVTNVDEGDEVSFIATVADAELYRFVNWTKGGVEVSTSATYVTTITESTNLIANFDYIRNTYCHTEINSVQNKKLYLTLGSIGGGQYQIKIEGSAEAKLTALTNANYTINWVTTDIVDGDKPMSGQDVPFSNARWAFDASGYGSATAVFGISEGKTWEDIHVWNHAIYFMTAAGEVGYTAFPDRYHIAWNETCADAEAPVFTKTEGFVIDANTVRLAIEATDNWEGMLTYTIARAGAEPIISNHASGEEFAQEITGLTPGTEYDFTVTVSDGVNNANAHIIVTPEGDATKPVMGEASLASKTWNSAIINVTATDNLGVAAYYIAELDAEYVPAEGKITVDGLTQGTAYTFTIKAKDAAGNISDNSAEVSFTTDTHILIPTTAPDAPTWADELVMSIYSDAYTPHAAWGFLEGWGQSTTKTDMVIAENNIMKYSNFDYLGWQAANPYNVINMEKLHLDIWVENDCELGIIPIYGGPGLTTDDSHRAKPALTGQQWNSIDLDLATDYDGLNLASIFQFKFDQGTTAEFFIDNVYFYREAALVDDEAPANVSGNVVSQSFYSVTLSLSATDDNGAVTYTIKDGDTQVAYTAGASGATVNVKVDNLTPGTDYAFSVIAKDGSDNAADAITVNASTLATPAPAPIPTSPADMVKSIYSETYTSAISVGINFNEWWWQSPTIAQEVSLGGNNARFYSGLSTNGSFGITWSENHKLDAAGYQILHFHIYPLYDGTIEVYPVIQPENQFHRTSQELVGGQWNEVVIDYTDKENFAPFNQFGIVYTNALGDFFIDNLYFEKPYELNEDEDNGTTIDGLNGQQVSIKVNRSFALNSGHYTLVLPFDLDEDAVAAKLPGTLTELSDSYLKPNGDLKLNFVDVTSMTAGKAYLYLPSEAVTNPVFENVTIKTSKDDSETTKATFVGIYAPMTITALRNITNSYVLGPDNYLYTSSQVNPDGGDMKALRAYFTLDFAEQYIQGRRTRAMVVFNEPRTDMPTDVEEVEEILVPAKRIENGQLIIEMNGRLYNAQGQVIR